MPIKAALEVVAAKSRELDPDKKGVHFALRLSYREPDSKDAAPPVDPRIHPEISFQANNNSLADVLDRVSAQTGLEHAIDPGAAYLWPPVEKSDKFSVRSYLLPPNALTGPFPPADDSQGIDVEREIEGKGNSFSRWGHRHALPRDEPS